MIRTGHRAESGTGTHGWQRRKARPGSLMHAQNLAKFLQDFGRKAEWAGRI